MVDGLGVDVTEVAWGHELLDVCLLYRTDMQKAPLEYSSGAVCVRKRVRLQMK